MYHQKIPSYNGAQPFIYAVYCKEDEALVYPVLGRMYNEGFRVCCAPATGISSDFHTQQRLAAASSVIIFISQQMSERLRTGDPEVVTAARSPLVRTVVLLDDSDVKNSAFAMSVPDHERYQAENDSAFWLYIYSNDYFDCCRGPWPENKLLLREPTYEDVSEDVLSEEYRRLENIMSGSKASSAEGYNPFDRSTSYQNNPGYIEPQPDEFTYIPLGLVESARTEHDDQLDEILGMINLAEDAVAQSLRRAEENTVPVPEEQPALFAEEIPAVEEAQMIEEQPEPAIEAEPKADLIVTPQPAVIQPEEPELILAELPEKLPESPAAQSSIIASAEILRESEPEIEEEPEASSRCSSVQVMVKLRQQACHVQPVRRTASRAVHAPAAAIRAAMNSRRTSAAENILPPTVEDNVSFEQYIRSIARSVVTELPQQSAAQAEEAAPSRKFRQRAAASEPVAEPVQAAVEETAEEEKPSARKNRFPHSNSEFLRELLSSLRRSRTESAESGDSTAETAAGEAETPHSILSEIIPEDPRELLQNVIDKFIEVNTVPSRMVVPRTVRRYRD